MPAGRDPAKDAALGIDRQPAVVGRAERVGGLRCPFASRKRAKRKASVALPMPRGPLSRIACGSRPDSSSRRKRRSALSWPTRSGFARGAGGAQCCVVCGSSSAICSPRPSITVGSPSSANANCAPLAPPQAAAKLDRQALRDRASTARCSVGSPEASISDAARGLVGGDSRESPGAASRGRRGRGARTGRRHPSAPLLGRARLATGRSRISVRSGAKSPRAKRCKRGSRSSGKPRPYP